ncbi:hypothetical protein [Flavisphingomonas formosensis]|uniref:hypothetical protein n=1 Tax=Flavisphingomonas formosensis TaxID=861534 RepID=UPI0012F943BB|nr:hypothetical protein [Sphingomonas formosensis]
MLDTKAWWQSRTIWLNIVATVFAVLGAMKLLPEGLEQDQVVTAIMAIVGVVNFVLRIATKHAIGPAQ